MKNQCGLGLLLLALSRAHAGGLPLADASQNDPAAGTWLPIGPSRSADDDAATAAANAQLASLNARLRPLVCGYQKSALAWSRAFTNGEVQTASSQWSCRVQTTPVADQPGAFDLSLAFKLVAGEARQAGVAAAFDFAAWSTNNYVLIPASVYNGNRNRTVDRAYASGLDRKELYQKDLPLTTDDLPRLSLEPGRPSKLEVLACNITTPAICVFDRKDRRGFIVLAEQAGRNSQGGFIRKADGEILDNGFAVEESADRTHATLVVSAPGVRERKPEFIGFSASPDRGTDLTAGDRMTLRLRVFSFPTPDIPGLLAKFMTVRKDVTGPNQPRDLIPMSEVFRLMTQRIDSRFYDGQESRFYCPENAAWISFGWVGGLMDTFPMLAQGDPWHLARVASTFDFAIPRAQGRAGYFYGALNHDGKVFGREGYDEFPEIVLTRKNDDVLFWMIKQFMLLKAQGRAGAIKPAWERATRRLAQAFADTWQRDGQWGNFLNNQTGAVAVYNTTSGAMAIGGLALAAKYFHEPAFLRIARRAADFYYERDLVKQGMTTGGCADILQNADSETAAGFMTSLMALYETTGDKQWLEKSQNLANLVATWTVSYDYELPANAELAHLGAKLAGVVWASTQNKHGAPGICCSSGDPLFKIYRDTGDRRYADLIRDIVHAHAEGIRPDGRITERLTYCDADSRGSRGSGSTGWNELNGALMALELPGIYVRTDKGELYVFDSVQAKMIDHDRSGAVLAITNPTRFDADVAIFAENARQAARPSGCTAFLNWPKVEVKAGATVTVQIKPEGMPQSKP